MDGVNKEERSSLGLDAAQFHLHKTKKRDTHKELGIFTTQASL